MRTLAVIPVRFASKRLSGKPLLPIDERPMVQWVYEAAQACPQLDRVVVATDDDRIVAAVEAFGGEVELTRDDHRTGSERVSEVSERYPEFDVIVNVQGDQPFVSADMLAELLGPYAQGDRPEMSTLACPLAEGEYDDPNVVKVVCDRNGDALYFSRSPIPHGADDTGPALHHIGLYAFRADFLATYAGLPETELERCERLEQLRVLEHGYRIVVRRTGERVLEVNTPADYERAQSLAAGAVGA